MHHEIRWTSHLCAEIWWSTQWRLFISWQNGSLQRHGGKQRHWLTLSVSQVSSYLLWFLRRYPARPVTYNKIASDFKSGRCGGNDKIMLTIYLSHCVEWDLQKKSTMFLNVHYWLRNCWTSRWLNHGLHHHHHIITSHLRLIKWLDSRNAICVQDSCRWCRNFCWRLL